MSSVIIRTHVDTLQGVIDNAKHALHVQPKLKQGDTILIAQTKPLPHGVKQIRYRMTFVESHPDKENASDRIWKHHWPYIIEGEAIRTLRCPFDIAEHQVSSKNYGQGGPFVYVDPRDEEILRKAGYFDVADDANM